MLCDTVKFISAFNILLSIILYTMLAHNPIETPNKRFGWSFYLLIVVCVLCATLAIMIGFLMRGENLDSILLIDARDLRSPLPMMRNTLTDRV